VSYSVALIDFVQFSRWCVFYSIMEYALANWLMRVEKRIEAAAAKVAKQEEAPEKAAEGSADVPPGTLVELGEVQVNGDAAPATEPPTGLRRRSIPSTVLSHAASFTDSVLKKRNSPAIKKHLHGVDRFFARSDASSTSLSPVSGGRDALGRQYARTAPVWEWSDAPVCRSNVAARRPPRYP